MDLPLVIDIAIGLIFIFLILSLLASEIQELITTLLQWRAEHLKKSIEVLLTGDSFNNMTFQKFTDELYQSPLLSSLNQEAKGSIARFFRRVSHFIGDLYRTITRSRNVFGDQRSGPSYIPSDAFAITLLQKLDIETVSRQISESTIRNFRQDKLDAIASVLDALRYSLGDDTLLRQEFSALESNVSTIIEDFIRGRISLATAIDLGTQQFIQFINNIEISLGEDNHCKEIIRRRLPYLRQSVLLRTLEPTITEVLTMIMDGKVDNLPPEVAAIVTRIHQANPDIPQHLKRNLISLAEHAQLRANGLEDGVQQLEQNVAAWFDRSMERASGVYRRNAKGVAILIGFLIAIATNADTFHMVNRLSKDSAVRSSITQAAEQAIAQRPGGISPGQTPPTSGVNPLEVELSDVRDAVSGSLNGLPLPIGWNQINMKQQQASSWAIPYLKQAIGWFITGIALSMGASFWYDLLGKVMRVRNSGRAAGSSDRTSI